MPDTSYHSWTMPTVDGSTDTWGQILNAMFDDEIDADVERRGTLANRPAAVDAPSGAKYLVTSGSNVGEIYIESSGSWTLLGTLPNDNGTIDTADLANDAVTAPKLAAGAVYPDIEFANSATSIQAAHDALPTEGGRVVITPAYDETNETLPISVTKPTIFEGYGWGSFGSTLGPDFSGNTTDNVFELDLAAEQPRNTVSFENLRVTGGDNSVLIGSGGFFNINRCWFESPNTDCVQFTADDGGLYTRIFRSFLETPGRDCVNFEPADEAQVGGGSMPHGSSIQFSQLNGAGRYGAYLDGHGVVINTCGVEGADSAGIRVAGGSTADPVIVNCYFEGNAQSESGGTEDADIVLNDGTLTTKAIGWNWHSSAGPAARAVHAFDTSNAYIGPVLGPSANVELGNFSTDVSVGWVDPRGSITVNSSTTRPRINGHGRASGNAEEPTASNWRIGETVEWTDTGDGSGTATYRLKYNGNWEVA